MIIKKRRILGYAYKTTKEKNLPVLSQYYGIDFTGLSPNQAALDEDIKKARKEGNFSQSGKARKFRLVLEEVE